MSPRMIVEILTGQDISLSRVLTCVSYGATAGEMAVALKKSVNGGYRIHHQTTKLTGKSSRLIDEEASCLAAEPY